MAVAVIGQLGMMVLAVMFSQSYGHISASLTDVSGLSVAVFNLVLTPTFISCL